MRRVNSGGRAKSDNQLLEQYFSSVESKPSGVISFIEDRVKMQPTSSSTNDDLDSVDLKTDNLPSVDTPDAVDKAALR